MRRSAVLIAYLTLDEVNQDLAEQLAEGCGITLHLLTFQETPLGEAFDAVVFDWDSLPASDRTRIQAELLAGPLPCPVAVHRYNVAEGLAAELGQNGVVVHRCLGPGVFAQLRQAAEQPRACRPPLEDAVLQPRVP